MKLGGDPDKWLEKPQERIETYVGVLNEMYPDKITIW
jgi:hypothetical protein